MINCKNSVFKKCAIAKIIAAVLIISLCSMGGFSVKNVFADEKDKLYDKSIYGYTLDDLRYIVGGERVYDIEKSHVLAEEASRLSLSAEQLTEATSVIGEVSGTTTTDRILSDNIKALSDKFLTELKAGYNPSIVIDSYTNAKKALDEYEVAYGNFIGKDEEMEQAIDKFMKDVEDLKKNESGKIYIGTGLGNTAFMPTEASGLAGTIETTGFGTIFVSYGEYAPIINMFNATAVSLDKSDGNSIIKFVVCDNFSYTYTCNMELDKDIKKKLESGEKVQVSAGQYLGQLKAGEWHLNVYANLDGKELDILRALGNNGAMLKQQFINENPALTKITNLWNEINEGKMYTEIKPSYSDKDDWNNYSDTIEAVYDRIETGE